MIYVQGNTLAKMFLEERKMLTNNSSKMNNNIVLLKAVFVWERW